MSADAQLLSEPQRQSTLAIIFLALRVLRNIGIAQLVVAVLALSRLPIGALFVVIPLVGLAILGISLLSWWRYTFMVSEGELRVTKGVLAQDRLTVPLDRVQSVSIEQGLLHRIAGLVNVSVDTAGTSEAEFEIDAVERPIAEALQRLTADATRGAAATAHVVVTDAPPPPASAIPERLVLKRTPRRLITAGLTRPAFAGLAFLFPIAAFGDEVIELIGIELPTVDGTEAALWMAWLIPAAVVAIAIVAFAANLIQIVVTDWELSLTLREKGLVRDAGLLSKSTRATTIDRVQRLEVRRNPLEARFGIQRVALPTIGDGDLHLAGTDDDELTDIRSLVIDAEARVVHFDRSVSPLAVFLATRNIAIVAALLAAGLFFTVGFWSLLAFVLVPWVWAVERRKVRLLRWGFVGEGIAQQHQYVSLHREEMMLRKVNGASVRQGLFERKRGLATVHLQTADGGIAVGMITLEEAKAVRDRALMVAETNTKAWM